MVFFCHCNQVLLKQEIGDITKKIFEAQVKGILRDLAAELSRADP